MPVEAPLYNVHTQKSGWYGQDNGRYRHTNSHKTLENVLGVHIFGCCKREI